MNCQDTEPDYVETLNENRKYPWVVIDIFYDILILNMKVIDIFMSSVIQSALRFEITN